MVRTMTTNETDAMIAGHIGPHPANPGIDEYWLTEPGIPVWAIIGQWQVEGGDADETAAAYHITREQLDAVLAFYERHPAAIDHRLAQNRTD